MKKIFIYFFAFLFICFIFPALLTKREKETSSEVNNIEINDTSKVEENAQSQYEYKKYGTIKLLHQKTGEVEEVNLDTYLCNVVSAEMPADYEKEALKAQAVVARTYTIYKIENKKHDNASGKSVCRELVLVKVRSDKDTRQDIMSIANIFRANIVDVSKGSMIIELTGATSKCEAFLGLLDGFEIIELVRTGLTGLVRGQRQD